MRGNTRWAVTLVWAAVVLGAGWCWGEVELPICTAPNSIQGNPAASGSRVVWEDRRTVNPDLPSTGGDIYLYDYATRAEKLVCAQPGDQIYPSIDGDRIVWLDQRSGSWAVYVYDIPTAKERKIADVSTPNVFNSLGPDISGDLVVWADDRYDPTGHTLDILLYNLATDTLTRITDGEGEHGIGGARVQGTRIVWCDTRTDPSGDIYMYDTATMIESAVSAEGGTEGQPDIWGDTVVWTRGVAEGVWNIYYRDLGTMTVGAPIDSSAATQACSRIGGQWVAWEDSRAGGGDGSTEIRVYGLAAAQVHPLTASAHPYGDWWPAVSEAGIVAWMDWRNGNRSSYENPDIYGYVLTRFWDVLENYWAYGAIESCAQAGIVSGYAGGDYQPGQAVTRDQLAVFIARGMNGGEPTGPATVAFTDITNPWANVYIAYCVEHGVVQGYDATHYQPSLPVTRDQMAVFIARAKGWVSIDDPMNTAPELFADVPAGYWAGTAIAACVDHGVANGYDATHYQPTWIVTRDQMAVFVQRAFGLPM